MGRRLKRECGTLESVVCMCMILALVQWEVPVGVFDQYDEREVVPKV